MQSQESPIAMQNLSDQREYWVIEKISLLMPMKPYKPFTFSAVGMTYMTNCIAYCKAFFAILARVARVSRVWKLPLGCPLCIACLACLRLRLRLPDCVSLWRHLLHDL